MGVLLVYPSVSAGGGSDTLLRTFTVQETSGTDALPTGSYVNGFVGFAAGDIPSGSKPEIRKADGTTALAVQQFDAVKTNADGDTLLAAYTFKTEDALAAAGTVDYKAYKTAGSLNNTSALTSAGITGSHAYAVVAVVDGVTYTALLSDYIDGSDSRVHCSGPVCKEWTVSGALKNAGTDHAKLWARFYVRLHEDGTISIAAKLHNNYVESGGAITITSCALKDGATTIDSQASLTLPPNSCVRFGKSGAPYLRHWTANEPAFFIKPDMQGLQDGGLQFKLKNTAGIITAIGTAPAPITYDPDDPTKFFGATDQNATGGQPWVGEILSDDAKALVTQDYDWHLYALSKQIYSHLATVHFYEKTGFYPAVVNNLNATYSMGPSRKSDRTTGGTPTIVLTGLPTAFDMQPEHYPGWAYYPYITTGLREWLDEVQIHPLSIVLSLNQGNGDGTMANMYVRNPTIAGTTYWGTPCSISFEMRGVTWGIRSMANAAFVTPDNDIAKQYFDDLENVTLWPWCAAFTNFNISDNADRASLGLIEYSYGNGASVDAPWMSSYNGIVMALAIKRGRIDLTHAWVTHHLTKYEAGRFVNGCAYSLATYNMTVAQSGDTTGANPLITSWDQAYVDDVGGTWTPSVPGGGCPVSGFRSVHAYSGGHTYPSLAHASVAALAHVGVAGADTALAYFTANEPAGTDVVGGSTVDSGWAATPQWGVRP